MIVPNKKLATILDKVKSGVISKDDAEKEIMQVSNLDILGVDEYNVDEIIDDYLNGNTVIMHMRKSFLTLFVVFVYIWSWSNL